MTDETCLLLTVRQAAERMTLSTATVYELVRLGRLPAVRIGVRGGAIRIRSVDLDVMLQPETRPVPQKATPRAAPRVKLRHIRLPQS